MGPVTLPFQVWTLYLSQDFLVARTEKPRSVERRKLLPSSSCQTWTGIGKKSKGKGGSPPLDGRPSLYPFCDRKSGLFSMTEPFRTTTPIDLVRTGLQNIIELGRVSSEGKVRHQAVRAQESLVVPSSIQYKNVRSSCVCSANGLTACNHQMPTIAD